ncbi:hypothetical protein ACP70R_041023 [Stipagrostis hirtigluma subsp. patula]
MGRRRRFATLASTGDEDDDDAEVPTAKLSAGGSSSSGPNPKRQRRRLAAADDDDDMELEEEEDERDLEAMLRDEEEEKREETQTRRRRGRPRRRAPESDEEEKPEVKEESEEEEPEDEEPREEENTDPVPIGKPVKVTGKGEEAEETLRLLRVRGQHSRAWRTPCCSRLRTAIRSPMSPSSRPEEAEKKGGVNYTTRDTRELFYSFHIDDVPAESVMHKCVVHFIPQCKQIPSRKQHPGFIVQKVYDAVQKRLWNLTDKDYEDGKQQEIDLLVKKTMDRIGQLPDLEPEDMPRDNTDHLSNK